MTVYVDVLIAINLFINYLLLLGTTYMAGSTVRRLRILLASALSGAFSVAVLFQQFNNVIFKILLCIVTVLIAFPLRSWREFLKNTLLFLAVNFVFAGLMVGLELTFAPQKMIYINGFLYFDIPIGKFIIFAGIAYLLVEVIVFFTQRSDKKQYRVVLVHEGKSVETEGFVDTGNKLSDPFNQNPVVVCSFSVVAPLLSAHQQLFIMNSYTKDPAGLRLIPCSTVTGDGLLPVFYPDSVRIYTAKGELITASGKVTVGIRTPQAQQDENPCILHPEMIGKVDFHVSDKTAKKAVWR